MSSFQLVCALEKAKTHSHAPVQDGYLLKHGRRECPKLGAAGVQLLDGQEKLQELVHLPRTWPLARLTIPLAGLSKQIDQLSEGYCFQILATNRDSEAHNGSHPDSHASYLDLGWVFGRYYCVAHAKYSGPCLQDLIRQWHSTTLDTWILPLYWKLLNSARRIRPSAPSERARGCTGLVKIICKENKEQKEEEVPCWNVSPEWSRGIYPMVWVLQLNEYALCVVSS